MPDTGSFELLAASTACLATCGGGNHSLFNASRSSTFSSARERMPLAYGQWEVEADLCNETIGLGSLRVPDQNFLMMTLNALKDWEPASYDAVMGIGPLATVALDDPRPALMTSMNITKVGVCYGPADGSPGRIDLGGGSRGWTTRRCPRSGSSTGG